VPSGRRTAQQPSSSPKQARPSPPRPTALLRLGDDQGLDELQDAAEELEKEAADAAKDAAEAAEEAAEEAEELQEKADKAAEADKPKKPDEPGPGESDNGGLPVNPAPDLAPDKPEKAEKPGKTGSSSPGPTPDQAAGPGKPGGPSTGPDAAAPDSTSGMPGPKRDPRPDVRPVNPTTGAAPTGGGPSKPSASGGGRSPGEGSRGSDEATDASDSGGRVPAQAGGRGGSDPDRGTGLNDSATIGRPTVRECLGQARDVTRDCDDHVVAGLSGPDQWRDGGGVTGERSEAFRLFDADPDLARAQQRNGTLAAGGSDAGWSEIGTAQLVLVTIVPPLVLLALGYVALGRRYP
jgi:hypothetical protein